MTLADLRRRLTAEVQELQYNMMADVIAAYGPHSNASIQEIADYMEAHWRDRWINGMIELRTRTLATMPVGERALNSILFDVLHQNNLDGLDLDQLQVYVRERQRKPQ
jgi:hypothetical protein